MTLSSSTYKKLADSVDVFHFVWMGIMLAGIFLQLIWPWYVAVQWAVIVVTGSSQILWGGCPLVALAQSLRAKYDPNTKYYGSFTYHMFKKIGITIPPFIIATQMILFIIISVVVLLVFGTPF